MISQNIDLVAGNFNRTAWLCRSRDNISAIYEVFSDSALPTPPGPTPLWRPGSMPNNWADVNGFLKPPGSQRPWKVNKHGAPPIFRQALGLRSSDQRCHHETWLHLQFVQWSNQWNHQAHYNGNIRLKERPARELQNVTSAEYSATTRSHLYCATTCAPGSHDFPCSSSRSDLMSFDISSISSVFLVTCSSCSSCAHCPKKKKKSRISFVFELSNLHVHVIIVCCFFLAKVLIRCCLAAT